MIFAQPPKQKVSQILRPHLLLLVLILVENTLPFFHWRIQWLEYSKQEVEVLLAVFSDGKAVK